MSSSLREMENRRKIRQIAEDGTSRSGFGPPVVAAERVSSSPSYHEVKTKKFSPMCFRALSCTASFESNPAVWPCCNRAEPGVKCTHRALA